MTYLRAATDGRASDARPVVARPFRPLAARRSTLVDARRTRRTTAMRIAMPTSDPGREFETPPATFMQSADREVAVKRI
jgi:hypothetical protein